MESRHSYYSARISIGLTDSIVSSKGVKNFSLYAKRFSGTIFIIVGLYFGMTSIRAFITLR